MRAMEKDVLLLLQCIDFCFGMSGNLVVLLLSVSPVFLAL